MSCICATATMIQLGSRVKCSQKEVISVTFRPASPSFCITTAASQSTAAWFQGCWGVTAPPWLEPPCDALAVLAGLRGDRDLHPDLELLPSLKAELTGDLWSSTNRKCNWFSSLRSMTGVTFPELDKGGPDVHDRFLHKHFTFFVFLAVCSSLILKKLFIHCCWNHSPKKGLTSAFSLQ